MRKAIVAVRSPVLSHSYL